MRWGKVLCCRKWISREFNDTESEKISFSFQTWPYIFQQVPDLNANKIPVAPSKEVTRKSDFTQLTATSMSFASFDDDSHIRSVTHHSSFGSRCHEDFDMSYDWIYFTISTFLVLLFKNFYLVIFTAQFHFMLFTFSSISMRLNKKK